MIVISTHFAHKMHDNVHQNYNHGVIYLLLIIKFVKGRYSIICASFAL